MNTNPLLQIKSKARTFFLFCIVLTIPFNCTSEESKKRDDNSKSNILSKKDTPQTALTLRLLVWEGYTPEKFVKQFEREATERYGRPVIFSIKYAESSDDFFNVIRSKSVDLITISHHSIKDEKLDYINKGLIIKPNLKNIPNFASMIPQLKTASYHTDRSIIYGIPVANGPYGLAYNTKIFKKAPTSWSVFWDPKHKDKYILGKNEYLYNTNIAALVLGYDRTLISDFDGLNNKTYKEKLRAFAQNAHYHWIGVDKPENYAGMHLATSWGDALMALKRQGEHWEMADPKEGTLWWIDDHVLTNQLKDKPVLKKIAEEWINMTLSPEFQLENNVREVGIYPVVTSIIDQLTPAEKRKIKPESFNNFMNVRILQQTHSHRDRNGLKLLWDNAMKNTTPSAPPEP